MRRIIVNITERGLDGDPLLIEAESVDSAIKELKEFDWCQSPTSYAEIHG